MTELGTPRGEAGDRAGPLVSPHSHIPPQHFIGHGDLVATLNANVRKLPWREFVAWNVRMRYVERTLATAQQAEQEVERG